VSGAIHECDIRRSAAVRPSPIGADEIKARPADDVQVRFSVLYGRFVSAPAKVDVVQVGVPRATESRGLPFRGRFLAEHIRQRSHGVGLSTLDPRGYSGALQVLGRLPVATYGELATPIGALDLAFHETCHAWTHPRTWHWCSGDGARLVDRRAMFESITQVLTAKSGLPRTPTRYDRPVAYVEELALPDELLERGIFGGEISAMEKGLLASTRARDLAHLYSGFRNLLNGRPFDTPPH
jgi:hypothetical protein